MKRHLTVVLGMCICLSVLLILGFSGADCLASLPPVEVKTLADYSTDELVEELTGRIGLDEVLDLFDDDE